MVFLVIQPRVRALARETYADVDVYLYRDGRAEKLETLRSDESDLNAVVLALMSS